MARRRKGYRRLIEAELVTLPFMSLFVVLIPMLLISAVFLHISVVDLSFPGNAQAAPPTEPPLALTVSIRAEAFVIEAEGQVRKVVPREAGDPMADLSAGLAEIASSRPDQRSVTIVSLPDTRYEDIIAVMDAARDAGLPDVSLAGEDS
jgi:biopolymer transport protein ExbD